MSLAQRVRDYRYAKGWGPDELASRAEISRTALYQIESGKTEQPRASTLRRIAQALSVPTESLLGQTPSETASTARRGGEIEAVARAPGDSPELRDSIRFTPTTHSTATHATSWTQSHRERDLERKFVELLRSPLGEGMARIVEETYRLMPAYVEAIR